MSADPRIEWTGRVKVYQPAQPTHMLVEDTRLCSAARTYLCTGCSWTVEVHPVPGAAEALDQAFTKHLATEAGDETMKTIQTTTRPIRLPEANDPKEPSMVRFYCDQCGHHHGEPDNQWPRCGAIKYSDPGPGVRRCQCTHEAPPTT